jgi:thiol-disulfide isomerase/thioredoxin
MVDQDPDFYVIDRAGQMRFADIDNRSVERAVEIAIKETAEQAAAVPTDRAAEAAKAEEDQWRTRGLTAEYIAALRGADDLQFELPESTAYEGVKWPENKEQSSSGAASIPDLVSKMGGWTWIGQRPNVQGKIVVIDFWRTWCGPCKRAIPGLEALQNQHRNELAIIGLSGKDDRENESVLRSFLAGKRSAYFHAYEESNSLMTQMGVNGFPTVIVLSSDGVIRWRGHPMDKDFRKAVESMINADPGVKARREARAAMLRRLESENR